MPVSDLPAPYNRSVPLEQFARALHATLTTPSSSPLPASAAALPASALLAVGLCRDELSRPVRSRLQADWGDAFDLSSLAGALFAGRTALQAAEAHVVDGGVLVLVVMSHIGLADPLDVNAGECPRGPDGSVGHACGGLMKVHAEMRSGSVDMRMDDDDLEYSLLKQHVLRRLPWGSVPTLPELTVELAAEVDEVTRRLVPQIVAESRRKTPCVVVTGINVHTKVGDRVCVNDAYAVDSESNIVPFKDELIKAMLAE